MTPVEPKPAASVVLIRPGLPRGGERVAAPASENPALSPDPLEVYVIRRHSKMRFLGGYYAFPGGKVDVSDVAAETLARCRGVSAEAAERLLPSAEGIPALAYWVTAIRELFEETGVLIASDGSGRPVDPGDRDVAARVERCRKALIADECPVGELLAREGWYLDLRLLRYLSHFITPASSPIRFTARFFLSPLPVSQEPRLFLEETSEGFWVSPREAYRRFSAGEMAMAEPAEYAFRYLAQFDSEEAVWANHVDGRHRFHGTVHQVEFYGKGYDWATGSWKSDKPAWHP